MVESKCLGERILQASCLLNSWDTLNLLFSKMKHFQGVFHLTCVKCLLQNDMSWAVDARCNFFFYLSKRAEQVTIYLSSRCLHLVRRILLCCGVCLGSFSSGWEGFLTLSPCPLAKSAATEFPQIYCPYKFLFIFPPNSVHSL